MRHNKLKKNIELEAALLGNENEKQSITEQVINLRKEKVNNFLKRWQYVIASVAIATGAIGLSYWGIKTDAENRKDIYRMLAEENNSMYEDNGAKVTEQRYYRIPYYNDSTTIMERTDMSSMNAVEAMAPIEKNTDDTLSHETEEAVDVNIASDYQGTIWYAPEWYNETRMSYMDYTTITCIGTAQYDMQYDGYTYTDYNTGIRMRAGRYCVAVGQEFGLTGTMLDVYLENGAMIPCIVADSKQYFDTMGGEGRIGNDGGIIEFVVETWLLPEDVQWMGSNEAQYNYYWQSPVEYIVVYD